MPIKTTWHRNYFFVNGVKSWTYLNSLTGGQIKDMTKTRCDLHLCYENPLDAGYPWIYVSDNEAVQLSEKTIHFFASPPATMR